MDLTMIAELIASLGFPIACAIALGLFVYLLWKQSVAREEKLMNLLTECRQVNAQAIETISKYADRLTHIEDNVEEIKDDVVVIKQELNKSK